MDSNEALGYVQIAGGSYLGYYGINHGLPRAAGIRIEYHTTSKENAKSIKKQGNILDPSCGGKGGWSEKINSQHCVNNSKGFVHITGVHKDSYTPDRYITGKQNKYLRPVFRTFQRKSQNIMYKTVGNTDDFMKIRSKIFSLKGKKEIRKEILKTTYEAAKKNILHNRTERFCIPGIDSYFDKNFIPDVDDIALKSDKPVKVYTNRFSAMIEGLKTFGLKGIKENKGRVAFGVGLLALGLYFGVKLIKKGINNIA